MTATLPTRPTQDGPMRWDRDSYQRAADAGAFDGRRVQLINGEIIEMAAMNRPHADALERARDVLLPRLPAGGHLHQQVPIGLWTTGPRDGNPEPDGLVLDAQERVQLVLEISDTTLDRDLGDKATIYALAGAPLYWVLDLNGRRLHLHHDPLPDGAWREVTIRAADEALDLPWSGATIAVADLLPPSGDVTA
jgi:Uma2 family endonuclease